MLLLIYTKQMVWDVNIFFCTTKFSIWSFIECWWIPGENLSNFTLSLIEIWKVWKVGNWPFDVYHFLSALFSASKMNFFWPWNRKIFQNQKLCFLLIFLTWQFRAWNMFQKYWNLCRTEYEVKLLRFVQVIVWLRECKIFFKKIALFTLHKQCFCC